MNKLLSTIAAVAITVASPALASAPAVLNERLTAAGTFPMTVAFTYYEDRIFMNPGWGLGGNMEVPTTEIVQVPMTGHRTESHPVAMQNLDSCIITRNGVIVDGHVTANHNHSRISEILDETARTLPLADYPECANYTLADGSDVASELNKRLNSYGTVPMTRWWTDVYSWDCPDVTKPSLLEMGKSKCFAGMRKSETTQTDLRL